ncbi:putative bifunctional diguanylate cyclase/phosphodiesterase [Cupriavidus sp. 30B13]|uniref:putative bifunctional diguanylate cyclase/phosphodiesterase n=1 Tax=Cupriavidus sp. 30B13 TaxID=3384241 RepID=UPI003B90629B
MPSQMNRLSTTDARFGQLPVPLSAIGLDTMDNPVAVADARGRILQANASFASVFGPPAGRDAEAARRNWLPPSMDTMHGAAAGDFLIRLAAGQAVRSECLLDTAGGHPRWFSALTNPVFDDHGGLVNLVSVLTDITETKLRDGIQRTALEAIAQDRPLAQIMEAMCREIERVTPEVAVSVLRIDAEGRLRPLAAPSLPPLYSASIDGAPAGPCNGSCGTAAFRGEPVAVTDIFTDPLWAPFQDLARLSGMAACWSTPIKAGDGRVLGTFAFYYPTRRGPDAYHCRLTEICTHLCALALERDAAREHIRWQAYHDALTGLLNLQAVRGRTEEAIAQADRSGTPLTALFVDLDDFKQINDALGHKQADLLLQEIAARMRGHAPAGALLGRRSGDEFVMVLPGMDAPDALALAEGLRAAIGQPLVSVPGRKLSVSASIGACVCPAHGRDWDALMRHADLALREAKRGGRNRVRLFDAELGARALARASLEQALKAALQENRLQLHYQPKVRLRDDALAGVEALARWHDSEMGDISPARFIPLAEECGLVVELGYWVLDEACGQLARWRAGGMQVPSVAVNLSPLNFHHHELPAVIAAVLQRHGLAGADLTVEITEGLVMESKPEIQATLAAVRRLGVCLSMDDFGTGYSSLGHLLNLPVDEIKLDRSFVQGLHSHRAAATLVDAAIRIGQSIGLTLVAEGVEDESQRAFLRAHGCEIGQGYLFAGAMPPQAFEAWLAERSAAAPAI